MAWILFTGILYAPMRLHLTGYQMTSYTGGFGSNALKYLVIASNVHAKRTDNHANKTDHIVK